MSKMLRGACRPAILFAAAGFFLINAALSVSAVRTVSPQERLRQASVTVEYLETLEKEVLTTRERLSATDAEIAETEAEFARCKVRDAFTATSIAELRADLAATEKELVHDRNSAEAAERRQASFEETIGRQRATLTALAASTVRQQYERDAERISLARQERNELRSRIGARREDQSEVQHALNQERTAKRRAEATGFGIVRNGNLRIDAQAANLRAAADSAHRQVLAISKRREETKRLIAVKTDELASLRESLTSLPFALAKLREDRESISELMNSKEHEFRAATLALREQEDRDRAARSATPTTPHEPPVFSFSPAIAVPQSYSDHGDLANWQPQTSTGTGSPFGYYGRYYDFEYRPPVGEHFVRGYVRRNGTVVGGHWQTNSDDSFWNNWSSRGNTNPNTGRVGSKLPPFGYGGTPSYVAPYVRSNGTLVSGHWRRR